MSPILDKTLPNLRLHLLPRPFQLVRLPLSHPIPSQLLSSTDHSYVSITRTKDEISIILDTELEGDELRALFGLKPVVGSERKEEGVELDGPWSTFQVEGPMVLTLTGIMAALTAPLRDSQVPIFAVSTYDTDWLLVKSDTAEKAVTTLKEDGWTVVKN